MSLKWPRIRVERLITLLEHLGYQRVHQRGSHLKMRKYIAGQEHNIVIVVHHGRDIPIGHLQDVLKDVAQCNGIPIEDLIQRL